MTGVIYARYSSENQREESIEGQLRECKEFAQKNDIQIVGSYIDRALSAKTDNRPDFQRMIKDSANGLFDTVIVWKLDRFARNRYDSAHYKAMLRKNGVKVISATEVISDTAEGILLESLLEGMAEYYSADLAEKVIRGLTENALKCKYNGGTLPIGYTIDSEQFFQVDPLTAPAVLQAFKSYAEGASMQEVTDQLNIKGIRTKRGGKISINSVTRMLHNRKYIGEYKYRDIVQPGGIPAIVPQDLFDRVQERMIANKKAPAKHKAEDEYLLTTKLFCGKCQCLMVGESGTSHMKKKVHRYYKCVSVKNHKGCDKKTVRKEWIEDATIAFIRKIVFDDDLVSMLCETATKVQNQANTTLPLLKKQYGDTLKSIDNLLNAIQQGILTPSTKQRMEELEQQKTELSIQIIKEEMTKPIISAEDIETYFNRLRKLNFKKVEHRRRLIDTFINKIVLWDNGRIYFGCNYKDCSREMTFAELEEAGILGSDISALGAPNKNKHPSGACFLFEGFEFFDKGLGVLFGFAGLEDRRACHKDIGTCRRCNSDGLQTDPAIHLNHIIQAEIFAQSAEFCYFRHHIRHKGLTAETGLYRHNQDHIAKGQIVLDGFRRGGGFDRDGKHFACRVDLFGNRFNLLGRFAMDADQIGTGFQEIIDIPLRAIDH